MKKLLILFLLIAWNPAMAEERKALFAGGCFWCMQPPFDKTEGIIKTSVGYTAGKKDSPTYKEVSAGVTGHTEAIEVTYDDSKVSYEELLDIFWKNIDPFDAAGQFCDKGSQYRSGIYYRSEEEKALAEKSKEAIEKKFSKKVATEIQAASTYFLGEDYHQDYYKKNPIRYKYYRFGCGRDKRLSEIWEN